MDRTLLPFTIPLTGLRTGITRFELEIGDDFFACFPESPVTEGTIDLNLELDKRPDMILATFRFDGRVKTTCDRCLADIRLPVEGEQELILKYGDKVEDDDEVVWLTPDIREYNLAKYAYEFIVLAIPVVRTYECEEEDPRPCNMDMLQALERHRKVGEESEDPGSDNPFRNLLDQLNTN